MKKIYKLLTVIGLFLLFWAGSPKMVLAHGIHKDPLPDTFNSYMIRDTEFTNKNSMTEAQIQAFLVSKVTGGVCDTYHVNSYGPTPTPPWICLYEYRDPANGNKLASTIIYEAAQEFNINPQVILVTLQKEQSLVTDNWPWPVQYQTAMGYGCPDSTPGVCESTYWGFTNQVRLGTKLLRVGYDRACGNTISYPGWITTKYLGTMLIDGKSTYIGNCPTASLYNYTPHRPDSAWLTSTSGSHFYGNYNFIYFSRTWFGIAYDNGMLPVYRFYNSKNGTHFYTASEAEKNSVIAKYPTIYKYEAVVYTLNNTEGKNNVPLYRFYNMKNGTHFYTASEAEKNSVIARWPGTFKFEGIVYYVSGDASLRPVYRFWNTKGTHFYTASEEEKNSVIARWPNIFKYEGIVYYIAQ